MKNIQETITSHLAQHDFDIRKSHDARFVDQKCTPDVVCFMADCVLNMVATKPEFTVKDIWDSQHFIENARDVFNKPWPHDARARHEYDKLIAQPLKLLAYARILNTRKPGNTAVYSVAHEPLLDYVSRKEPYTCHFLYEYFVKVLRDSNFLRHLEDYADICKEQPDRVTEAKKDVYERYHRLLKGNTRSQNKIDATRMFHKVFIAPASK